MVDDAAESVTLEQARGPRAASRALARWSRCDGSVLCCSRVARFPGCGRGVGSGILDGVDEEADAPMRQRTQSQARWLSGHLRRRLDADETEIRAVDRDERRAVSVVGGVPARGEALPQRLRAVPARGRRLAGGALRPGRRAALAAGVGCAAYGVLHLYWALGGELLLDESPGGREIVEGKLGGVLNWASSALAMIGIALAVATVRARRLPRLLVVGLPALIAALLLFRATDAASDVAVLTGAADGSRYEARWDLFLWSPFFAAWGVAWGLAAVAARRRTAGPSGEKDEGR